MTALGAITDAEWFFALRRQNEGIMKQVNMMLQRAVAQGMSYEDAAKIVGDYFSPWFSTRRNPDGTLSRDERTGENDDWPGGAGMASAGARRLMLTELQDRFTKGVKKKAEDHSALVRYNLGRGHRGDDACKFYATQSLGFGPGVYQIDDFPEYPHPNCRCYPTMEGIDYVDY